MSRQLRERMVADMELAGLSKSTQAEYVRAVEAFVRQTWLSPAEAEEADLAEYLRSLAQVRQKSTQETCFLGIFPHQAIITY